MTIPPKGFYVHYKHDPAGVLHNYMYEVVGIGKDTEDESLTVLYCPLYKNEWFTPADFASRPLDMFLENVEKDGVTLPRFQMVTDPELVKELEEVRDRMYPYKQ